MVTILKREEFKKKLRRLQAEFAKIQLVKQHWQRALYRLREKKFHGRYKIT